MRNHVVWIALGILGSLALLPSGAKKAREQKADGKQIFQQHCASCHSAGENKISPLHPIVGSKQLATIAIFKSYLSSPPGHMPYYTEVVNDDATLQALYSYCKALKSLPIKEALVGGESLLCEK